MRWGKKPQKATPASPPARGCHSDESARTKEVHPKAGTFRKWANGQPPRTFEHDPWDSEMKITPKESDSRARNHPQMDKHYGKSWQQGRRGPV